MKMLEDVLNITWIVGFCVITVACCAQDKMLRLGESPQTQAIACMQRVLGKQVLLTRIPPLETTFKGGCPEGRAELLQLLKSQSLPVSVMEEDNWALLVPSYCLPPWRTYVDEFEKIHWKHFRVEATAKLGDSQQSQGTLSPDQLRQLKEQVLKQARFVQVYDPRTKGGEETAVIPLSLEVYLRRLRPTGPRSVVVVLRQQENAVPGRLIYGEETETGSFRLLWESPVIIAHMMALEFEDVDSDGIEEVVIHSIEPSGMRMFNVMTVFNIAGKEITRHLPCETPVDGYGYSAADGTCPIVGEAVEFDDSTTPWSILVDGLLPDLKSAVFKYRNGAYVQVTPQPRRREGNGGGRSTSARGASRPSR